MKIYTKTGDDGTTGLYSGERISKDDIRIEAYGTVDELNSYLGWVGSAGSPYVDVDFLRGIQKQLFTIGSHLAAGENNPYPLPELDLKLTKALETAMDKMNDELPKLKSFVLPGGSNLSGVLHVTRTVCRRSERRVISLSRSAKVDANMVIFLNRLSDYLFVLARYECYKSSGEEVLWEGV